jgi:uncharacterized protein (TIGR01244 family)
MASLLAFSFGGLAHAQEAYFATPKILDTGEFQQIFSQVAPKIYVAGQPTPAGLVQAKALGVTTVVNLRTDFEMNNRGTVPFDEAAEISSLELEYVHIPQGGPATPYSPVALSRFAEAVNQAQGKVLLHCTVAWRASHLWAAYLVEYEGVPISAALEIGRQVNLGTLPIEGFLGRDLAVDLK